MREYEKEPDRDPEATVVRPLFTEDAAEGARPVVPLDDRAVVEDVGAYVETGTAPHAYTRAWKRRTHWTAALVAAALIVGTLVGIAGLRLYQRGRTADAQKSPAPEQSSEAAVTSPPSAPAPSPEAPTAQAPVSLPAPAPETAAATVVPVEAEERERRGEETARRSDDERAEAPARRGRKGDDEEEDEPRVAERPRRVEREGPPPVYDTQGPAPEGSAAERRAAREEERLRRAERQMRRQQRRRERRGEAYMVDSIRGVFEGRRESPPR